MFFLLSHVFNCKRGNNTLSSPTNQCSAVYFLPFIVQHFIQVFKGCVDCMLCVVSLKDLDNSVNGKVTTTLFRQINAMSDSLVSEI